MAPQKYPDLKEKCDKILIHLVPVMTEMQKYQLIIETLNFSLNSNFFLLNFSKISEKIMYSCHFICQYYYISVIA